MTTGKKEYRTHIYHAPQESGGWPRLGSPRVVTSGIENLGPLFVVWIYTPVGKEGGGLIRRLDTTGYFTYSITVGRAASDEDALSKLAALEREAEEKLRRAGSDAPRDRIAMIEKSNPHHYGLHPRQVIRDRFSALAASARKNPARTRLNRNRKPKGPG
jgi:hypothetical protein